MKFDHRHGIVGSIIAFIIGTSCCWLSSLAIWLGGATVLGSLAMYIEDGQVLILTMAVALALTSIVLWRRQRIGRKRK